MHNSLLYCFTNPLELGSLVKRLVKQYNQELCISSNWRCFIKRPQSRPLKWSYSLNLFLFLIHIISNRRTHEPCRYVSFLVRTVALCFHPLTCHFYIFLLHLFLSLWFCNFLSYNCYHHQVILVTVRFSVTSNVLNNIIVFAFYQ